MKRKQKQAVSMVMTFSMLLSGMGMAAAAEPIEQNAQPTITVDAGAEMTLGTNVGENEEEPKKETEESTEEEIKEGTEEATEEETKEEIEEETGEEAGEETKKETEEGTKEETEEQIEEETREETGEEAREGTEEENQKDTGAENGEETKADDLPEDSKDELPAKPENPEVKPPAEFKPGVHEHTWSVDWNFDGMYHWHECDGEECPVADDSEKDGYAEHIYDEYGVCTECGYDAMEGIAVAAEGAVPTYREAYEAMIALKDEYPEGMTWTNYEPYGSKGQLGSAYTWKGGSIYGAKSGVGCMAFAFILSDEAFDNLPARAIEKGKFTFEDVKVGDILRVNSNSHSVIVLQKSEAGVTVAEGNYNKSVHWGRAMSVAEVKNADFIITRYPQGYVSPDDSEADEVAHTGTAGSLSWSLTTGGKLTISGSGAIPDYAQNNAPWSAYEFNSIIIEDGVTSIGNCAFYESEALSVYIPDSVTAIGQNAFNGSSLLAVTIPGSVRTIGNDAFHNCSNLTSATVSEGVATIGDSAFQGCTSLAYIDFPESITSVGAAAFTSCENMVSVRFKPGSGSVALGDNLFTQCMRLTQVTLPQTAECISAGMFQSCSSLPSLYIPASVQKIGINPFISCNALRTIYFGGSETDWKRIASLYLQDSLQSTETNVVFNAEFDDPFAVDPDDPGDFQPGESESCTNHVDTNKDGKCDNCGKAMSAEKPETPENPAPDGGSGDDKTDPDGSGGNTPPPATDSSGSSSSDSSSDSQDDSGSSGSGSFVISTTVSWGADGSRITTKTQKDGTVITVTDNAAGVARMEAKLSGLAIDTAGKKSEAVALPISAVPVVKDASAAPAITVYTQRDYLVKVAIPTDMATAGTVVVMVNPDGSTSVIRSSVAAENRVVASLPNGATVKIVDNSKSFADVPAGVWYEEAVSFVSARELFYNTTETGFEPGAPMTCAMLTTALARFDGAETDGGATWYEKSMEWAAARGIRDGSNPNSHITCDQLAVMLWKYQGAPAVNASSGNEDGSSLDDVQKAMDWTVKYGIINCFEEGAWAPQKPVNRSQAAQVIMNFVKKAVATVQ
ncbi:MAG: leucine-rich repeat protein [Hungatella sp.]|nr:leucine-rich repeat protein [Hungatella sp.]